MYRDIVSADQGGPRHAIMTPRDQQQVRSITKNVSDIIIIITKG